MVITKRPAGGLLLLAVALAWGCQHFDPAPLSPRETALRLDTRSLDNQDLRKLIEAQTGVTIASWPRKRWDLQALTLAALYYNPDLAIARARLETTRAHIRSAGARPNPTLSANPEYTTNAASGISPWVAAGQIDWPIETAGKRGHRIAQAEQLASAARLRLVAESWRVRAELRASLVDLTGAEARLPALGRMLATESQLLGLLEERLAVGAISRAELVSRQLDRIRTQAELARVRRQSRELRAQLATVIGVPAKALEGIDFVPPPGRTNSRLVSLNARDARRQALLGRADVLAALADYAASQSALQLEIAKQYPDLHLSNGYQFDQGDNKWGLGLSLELPVLDRNQGPIAEAAARRREAAARFAAIQARVIADIDSAVASQRGARAELEQLKALVDEQRLQAQRVKTALEAGAADLVEQRSAELALERSNLAFLEGQRVAQQALGRLEAALQRPQALFGFVPGNARAGASGSQP